MRKTLIISILVFVSISLFSQDIVYDTLYGNKTTWLRINGGPKEIPLIVHYENEASIAQSKILSAAGLIQGLQAGIDYVDYTFPYDTITYEFNTDVKLNLIVYKYYYSDTGFYYFIGLRKAAPGSDMFEGQYLFICPVVAAGSQVKVYDRIGSNRKLFMTFKPEEMNDNLITDYTLSRRVTVQGIRVSKVLRASKTKETLKSSIVDQILYNIEYWPNPVSDYLTIRIYGNEGVTIRMFNNSPKLMYQAYIESEETTIDVSSFASGPYIVVITNKETENIVDVLKVIIVR